MSAKTKAELQAQQAAICADPANRNTKGMFLYKRKARLKLDRIARDITKILAEERAARGDPVRADGWSGRQTKRGRS